MIPLAVVDQDALFRCGLRLGLKECGLTAEETDDLLTWARLGGRRLAVVSASSSHDFGRISAAGDVNAELVLVVICAESSATCFAEALRAGAASITSRSAPFEELAEVITLALKGKTVIPIPLARDLVENARLAPPNCPVSPRETKWIRRLARGETIHKLASESGYSEREMYRILHHVYDRMGARNRTEALVRAAGWGLL